MFFIIITIIAISVAGLYLYKVRKSEHYQYECEHVRKVRYAPQPSMIRMLLKRDPFHLVHKQFIQQYGQVYGYGMFGSVTIMVAIPELIQTVLSKEFHSFPNRRTFQSDDPFFGKNLANLELEQWKRLRAIVSQTFATGKLRKMKPKMDSICGTLIRNLNKHLDQSDDKLTNLKQYAGAFTMDTIIQVAFGAKVDSLIEPDNPIIKHAKQLFNTDYSLRNVFTFFLMLGAPKCIRYLFRNMRMNGNVIDFFSNLAAEIIERKRKEFRSNDYSKAVSFIEFMLEAEHEYELQKDKLINESKSNGLHSNGTVGEKKPSKYVSNDEMMAQCILFFLAGFETTASLITMACYYLALNPDKQQLAYEEVCRVIEDGDSLESIPFEYFSVIDAKLEFINGVINETLRLSTPVPFLERRCVQDCDLVTEDQKVKIHVKKGDIVQIPVWYLHYNKEHFPEPERFLPERFCRDHAELNSFHKYAYLPFGSGPRVCVAKSLALLEGKMALVWLIKNFRFQKCDRTKLDFNYVNGILAPKDIWLNVERRQ